MKRSDLTAEEQKNVRTALNRRSGTDRRNTVSASMAFRVARFVKVPVDDVVNGRYPAPGACPHCGHVPSDTWDDGEVKP